MDCVLDKSFWELKKKKNIIKYKIIAFDTENRDEITDLVNFYDGEKHYTFEIENNDMMEVYKFIYSTRKYKNCIFVAHNLEYDINNIFAHDEYQILNKMLYSGKLIYAELQKFPHKFIDSMNFYATSLKKIGEVVGIEKGDLKTSLQDRETYIEYCRQDTLILWEFMNLLQDQINQELKLSLPLTIGSLAIRDLLNNHKTRDYYSCNEPIFLKAYSGGRVEAFELGLYKNVHYMDFRSHYPTQMLKKFPNPEFIEVDKEFNKEFGVIHCKIKVPEQKFGPLPYKLKGKLCFPAGILKGFWTYHEIRNAVDNFNCELLEIYDSWGTDQFVKPFDTFILYHYDKRNEYREAGNDFGTLLEKLIMNNSYGKLIQHNEATELTTNLKTLEELEYTGAIFKKSLGPFYIYDIPQIQVPPFCNYLWGIYITSYARIDLLSLMKKIQENGQNVLYCDTDSIVYEHFNKNVCYLDRIGKDLTQVDFEKGESIEIFGLKSYIFIDEKGKTKVASKGVPNQLAIQYFRDKEVFVNKPTKLKESLVQKKTVNKWGDFKKKFTGEYTKRTLLDNGKALILLDFTNDWEREKYFLDIYQYYKNKY